MLLKVKDFPKQIIILGGRDPALSLVDQLMSLGIPSDQITIVAPVETKSYKEIPVYNKSYLSTVDSFGSLRVVVVKQDGVKRSTIRREVLEINPKFANCLCKDTELLAEVMAYVDIFDPPEIHVSENRTIWMGMNQNFVLGGIETWVSETYHDIQRAGAQCVIIEPVVENDYTYVGPEFYGISSDQVIQIGPYDYFADYTQRAIELICECPPAVFIDNGNFRLAAGIYIAKMKLGIPIKVVSVIHGDESIFYNRLAYFGAFADKVIAVSESIRENIIRLFPQMHYITKAKQRLPKVFHDSLKEKLPRKPIQIAYASRLEAGNKRSLWVKDVILGLQNRGVEFSMHIAGDGECLSEIRQFVLDHSLDDVVRLYGQIEHDKMNDFYKDKHVFVNFSEREGGPLTMLEAMGHGLVPVVTNAGMAKQLIRANNGYIISTPAEVVDAICALEADPYAAEHMGEKALITLEEYHIAQGDFVEDFL